MLDKSGTYLELQRQESQAGQTGTFPRCHILAKTVTFKECNRCTTNKAGNAICADHRCESPWRMCSACLAQGATGSDTWVTNARTGLCAFHEEKGAGVVRVKPQKVIAPGATIPTLLIERRTSSLGDRASVFQQEELARARESAASFVVAGAASPATRPLRPAVPEKLLAEAKSKDPMIRAFGIGKIMHRYRLRKEAVAPLIDLKPGTVLLYVQPLALHESLQKRMDLSVPDKERLKPALVKLLCELPAAFQRKILDDLDHLNTMSNEEAAREIKRRIFMEGIKRTAFLLVETLKTLGEAGKL